VLAVGVPSSPMGEKWWYLAGGVVAGYLVACGMSNGAGFGFSFGLNTTSRGPAGGATPVDQPTSKGFNPQQGVYNPVGPGLYPSDVMSDMQAPNLVGGGAVS